MPRSYPGSTPGIDPRSQGVIPRRFKRKNFFVTNERTNGRTDRLDGRNSDLDEFNPTFEVQNMGNETFQNALFWNVSFPNGN